MSPRFISAAAVAILAAAGLAVHLGKPVAGHSLEAVVTLWGDLFRDTSRATALPLHVSAEEEIRLGSQLAANVRAAYAIDVAHQPAVLRIGARLSAPGDLHVPYTFLAIDESSINAFSLPGGYVFVTRGLADFVTSDDELAAVIGHEMAHIELRHCLDGHRYEAVLARLGAADAGELMDAVHGALALSYSREQEFDADARGAGLARRAGYNPKAAAALFRRLAAQQPQPDTGWLGPYLKSHPAALERAALPRLRSEEHTSELQ